MECEIMILHDNYSLLNEGIENLKNKNYPFAENLRREYGSLHLAIADLEKLQKCIENVEEYSLHKMSTIEKQCCKVLGEFAKEIPEEYIPGGPEGVSASEMDIYGLSREVFEMLTFLKSLKEEFTPKFDEYEMSLQVLKQDAYECLKSFQENELKSTFWLKSIDIRIKMDRLDKKLDKAISDYEQFEKRLVSGASRSVGCGSVEGAATNLTTTPSSRYEEQDVGRLYISMEEAVDV